MTEKERSTPVRRFSSAGAEKLREMAENSETYMKFLKFYGRVYKHTPDVALEFFTQKPETKFIATAAQWKSLKYSIAQGSEAIRFIGKDGKETGYYDLSQMEQKKEPYLWKISKKNVENVKKQLEIPEKTNLISGVVNRTLDVSHITECMKALHVPMSNYAAFQRSFLNAVCLMMAGRIEVGGNQFNIQPDMNAMKMLKTAEERFTFLLHATNAARMALRKIETAVVTIETAERNEQNEKNELQAMADTNERTTSDNFAEKVNAAFSETKEPEKTAENAADDELDDLGEPEELTDQQRLVQLTLEIKQGEAQITDLVREKKYAEVAKTAQELEKLNKNLNALKERIQQQPITQEDVQILRNIQPPRKSVQNLLEHEVAQTTKFESLLHSEMGEKSAYEMRKSDNAWREDESKTVPVIEISKRTIPSKNLMSIRRNNTITRGIFTNEDANLEIIFGRKSIEEVFAKAIQDDKRNIPVEARIAALYRMQKLVEKSICFDSQVSEYDAVKSKNKSPNTLFMHKMYGLVKYDGEYYLAKLSAEESYTTDRQNRFTGTSNRIYNLRDVKITPIEANRIFSPAVATTNGNEDTSTSVTDISIPQLYALVKRYDKNFYENSESAGREEREAELYTHAEYLDAVNTMKTGEKITIETDKQLKHIADNHGITTEEAQKKIKAKLSKNGDTIIGNTTFRYIPQKTYTKIDKEITEKVAEILEKKGVKFSGVIKGDTATITTSKSDKEMLDSIIKDISDNRDLQSDNDNDDDETDTQTPSSNQPKPPTPSGSGSPSGNNNNANDTPPASDTGGSSAPTVDENAVQNEKVDTNSNFSEKTDTNITNLPEQSGEQLSLFETPKNFKEEPFPEKEAAPESNFTEQVKELVYEENRKAIDKIEVGDTVKIHDGTYTVTSINGDFMMSMKNQTVKLGDADGQQFIGNWKEELLKSAGEQPLIVIKQNTLQEQVNHDETKRADTDSTISEIVQPEKKKMTNAEKLYRQFTEMFPDIVSGEHVYERYGNVDDAYEPLTVEHLGGTTYAFMTYFMQNGDMMRDPDFTFELDHENKALHILDYQQDGVPIVGTVYQTVHDEHGNIDKKLLAALEQNFMQNLKNAEYAERPLTMYTDNHGNCTESEQQEQPEQEKEPETVNPDKTPELREELNAFSEKHGFGELNIELQQNNWQRYNWVLSEKMQDGAEHQLGELYGSQEYGMPFTPETLHEALQDFENTVKSRGNEISELYNRKAIQAIHGGSAPLPKVQNDLPEITYASSPSQKISDNIDAIYEVKRLEDAAQAGEPLYDKRRNQYDSLQNSQERLRKYCGWGGLSQVFDERFKQFEYRREELKTLLSPEEYAAAKASTTDAHYTPQIIIDAMYKAVKNMDLPRDSRILEPSCGTGNFISRMPHSLGNAEVVGVELDATTAKIAKWLHHESENVHIENSRFEHANLENNSFDLAIGNVPFGDYNMNDPDYVQDWKIHDAFFRKALDKVAAGGVVAFVTSTGTMDKVNPKVREYLAERADLIGAIRLPDNAFADAGTKTPSDIIFLKKREHMLEAHEPKPDWCYVMPNADGLRINSYFVQNPQMLLGKMEQTTHFDRLTCKPIEGADLEKQLNEAIKNLNAKITVAKREKAVQERRGMVEPWGKNFTFQIKDDKIYYRHGNQMNEVTCNQTEKEMMKKLCEIRDVTRELLDLQKITIPDEKLIPMREKLNQLYDTYKSEYGELSGKATRKLFSDDSDYQILQSLEEYNKELEKAEKAAIFFRRTVNPILEIKSAENVEEAFQISLDKKGKPDIPYMAVLLQKEPDAVCNELLEKGQIFIDPEKNLPDVPFSGVVERSEYLSGNVRMKLTLAEENAKINPEYQRNVNALTKVIPEDIKAEEISVRMSCPWIEPKDYTDFLQHLSGRGRYDSRRCDVNYSSVSGEFEIIKAGSQKDLNYNESTTYGTADYNMYQLAEKILNQRRIVVQREKPHPKDPSKTVTRTDPKATKIALEKAKTIRAEFEKWIFANDKRKAKYERKYNDIFNSLVGREYDGSRLTFSGMANDFVLRQHQKNCVARTIYGGNTLAAHVVGAGKSAVMFTSVMKKKELGLIDKACVVVPKALTEQVANEWRKIYPDAKLLTVTNDDLSNEAKRNLFTARVATGSYDAVIMSQEQFEKIPMSKQYRIGFMQRELDNLEDMLHARKIETSGKRDYSVKTIEKSKKQLQTKLDKLLNPKSASKAKDDLLEFEQLGFDFLVCDEVHAYKNGFVSTKMTNVAGVTTRPSGRAEDMQMKTDYFNEQLGQGHILFCTGTPVSNSMTELYVMIRYLRPDLLKQAGVERFDDWAATFGNVVTKNQQAADGTLKLRTCFSTFANLPELMAMYKEFADVQSAEKLQLPRPELKTGKPQIVKVPASPEQRNYVKELAERAKRISDGIVDQHDDNLLKITGEARLVGLGNQAIQSLYKKHGEEVPADFMDSKDSKVDKCVEKVAEIYEKTNDTNGVQIIFSDIAVNSDNGNFSVYDYIKKELIDKGIPEEEIIFAPKSDSKERKNIFRDINAGKYRVVIASTGTLGTGANIQENLYALHHVDIPWKPSDFEQREGRILRQGNQNKEVEIFNYVTEETLDSYLYQTVTNKARFIAQLLDNKAPARVSEDCDEKVLTYGEIQAAAEGNPDFKRRIELSNEIAELTMLKSEYMHETVQTQEKLETLPEQISEQKELLSRVQHDKTDAEKIKAVILTTADGRNLTERKHINAYLMKMIAEQMKNPKAELPKSKVGNFEISVLANNDRTDTRFVVKGESVYNCAAGTTESQDNCQRLQNLFEKAIPKKEQEIIKEISSFEENFAQAKKRVDIPFAQEKELEEKMEEFQKLEEKLSGLSIQEDVLLDPEEDADPVIETQEEKQERESILEQADENDTIRFDPKTNDDKLEPPARRM